MLKNYRFYFLIFFFLFIIFLPQNYREKINIFNISIDYQLVNYKISTFF